ncbi:MAG: hypothetical protein Q9187_002082 [Circinaria calcarea]
MSSTISSFIRRGAAFLTPSASTSDLTATKATFTTAPEGILFPKVDPAIDGEDCERDCESCTIRYPPKFSIDEEEHLYGQIKGWATHMLVATGKTDWVRDVEDEKGSVMEAVRECGVKPSNGRLMLSASNMPVPHNHPDSTTSDPSTQPTTVLLLPSFTIIENVTPASVPQLITQYIDRSPTTTTPLSAAPIPAQPDSIQPAAVPEQTNGALTIASTSPRSDPPTLPPPLPAAQTFTVKPCPHIALILLCSQKTRDARCGQSAPLLRRELERHLRSLGLYRDLHDFRPGGVGIYFISHVGGHKFSANVMVYRKAVVEDDGDQGKPSGKKGEAGQCIWLARVRPEDCEGIVKFTVLQGKVVKPERQLRGGFDRARGLVSW